MRITNRCVESHPFQLPRFPMISIVFSFDRTNSMHHVRRFLGSILLLAACVATAASLRAADDRNASPEKERELIALLRSEAPAAEKAIACKLLAIHGSAGSVPELSRLLENEQLASWARIALEVIPGSEADAALRHATNSITGNLLIGTINSIGVRRDAGAVELLASYGAALEKLAHSVKVFFGIHAASFE